jgi:hypothetical protein
LVDDPVVLFLPGLGFTLANARDREEPSAVIALKSTSPRGIPGPVAPLVAGDQDYVHPCARRRALLVGLECIENLGRGRMHLPVDDAVIEVIAAQGIVSGNNEPKPGEGRNPTPFT